MPGTASSKEGYQPDHGTTAGRPLEGVEVPEGTAGALGALQLLGEVGDLALGLLRGVARGLGPRRRPTARTTAGPRAAVDPPTGHAVPNPRKNTVAGPRIEV
ncbi:hypothetical protein AB0A66_32695 [Streptomyces longwoodensis]|uniref:hypothetical protein n=1 Tax=Streptomyces longwoodensis TaxID=68231 RepID=UPI0033C429A5